jgi:hypothetical protein
VAKVSFTAGRINSFACPTGKSQAFLWDRNTIGLGLRVTPNGAPAFVFQGRYQGRDLRITIGSPSVWTIAAAQAKARELQRSIDEGRDPRELKRAQLAEQAAKDTAARAQQITAGEAWSVYLEDRRPFWGARHYADHLAMVRPAGRAANRGTRGRAVTIAGPLHAMMAEPLAALTPECITRWASVEALMPLPI